MQNGIFARKRLGKRLNVTYRTERFLKSEKCAMKRNPQFVLVGLKFKQFLIALFFFIFRTQCLTISEEKTFKPQRQEKVESEKNE